MVIFHIGDKVVHSPKGVCIVEEICQLDVDKEERFYYRLRPLKNKAKMVYLPANYEKLKVRPLKTKEEMMKLLLTEPEEGLLQNANPQKKRMLQYQAILEDNSELLIRLIKLYRRKHRERKLSQGDYRWLREAENYLITEIAEVLGCDYGFLLQQIQYQHLYKCA